MLKSVKLAKRLLDVVGASAALVCTAPLFPVVAAAVYLDSPGPIIYRQRRAGRLRETGDGSTAEPGYPRFDEFEMYKFRTMIIDAEKKTGAVLAAKDDPRVTRVGRILRRYRLDELPQLWNVLRGNMSLVGPRPERPERQVNLALAIPFFEERMRDVKPGLTGFAQVSLGYSGRPIEGSENDRSIKLLAHLINPFEIDYGDADVEADDMRVKLLYDLPYVASMERFSSWLLMELVILLRTPLVVVKGIGR